MNKDNCLEYIPLIQALAEDGVIQLQMSDGSWEDMINPSFDRPAAEYRRKPKPLEGWVNVYPDWSGEIHPTKEVALASAASNCLRTIKVREVTE